MPTATPWDPAKIHYPTARRDESFAETFKSKEKGEVIVPDPYHWLATPPSQSAETEAFVKAQAAFTADYLTLNPDTDKLYDALKKNWDYERFSCPSLKGDGHFYWSHNSGLQAQSILYRSSASTLSSPASGPGGSLFFDPNLLSSDGTAALSHTSFSESGQYWAYGISRSGSDWSTLYVRKTDSPHTKSADEGGERNRDEGRLPDELRWVKFSGITWVKEESGFFYQRFAAREEKHGSAGDDKAGTETDEDKNAMLYFHRLGDPQSADTLIIRDPDNPAYMWGTQVTEDGRYLCLYTRKDTGRQNRLWIADLQKGGWKDGSWGEGMEWAKVVDRWGDDYTVVANEGTKFVIMTNKGAPKNKIVTYDLSKPEEGFVDLIPEDDHAILEGISPIHQEYAIVNYSRDVKDEIYLYELMTGKRIRRIGEGLIGTIGQITGKQKHDEFFFSMSSFLSPGTIYRYQFANPEGQELSVFRRVKVDGIKAEDFNEEQVVYESKDGTRVPMFIVHRKDTALDGTAPALQYGYGGFSINITPFFSPSLMTFISHYRGVLAVPNIRGGGEYGEDWHLAGCGSQKQNVFDDFQAASKHLIDNKYAHPKKIAISGGSNGGLLVAACANQAPELYGAVVGDVGVLDMLRFHRYTIGRAWKSDYGDPDVPEDFDVLFKYSPLHNINSKATYPALMLLTADHDDRVVPLHSFKFAAALQHALPNNPRPLLLRVDLKAGHGAGKSTEMKIKEATDKWGFVASSLGLEWVD